MSSSTSTLLLLGALGGGLYFLSRQKEASAAPGGAGAPPTQQVTPQVTAAMQAVIASGDPTQMLATLGNLLNRGFTAEQVAPLMNHINQTQPKKKVIAGRSGRSYVVGLKSVFSDGTAIKDVLTSDGKSRIFAFREQFTTPGSPHIFLGNPPDIESGVLARAMSDFNVVQATRS